MYVIQSQHVRNEKSCQLCILSLHKHQFTKCLRSSLRLWKSVKTCACGCKVCDLKIFAIADVFQVLQQLPITGKLQLNHCSHQMASRSYLKLKFHMNSERERMSYHAQRFHVSPFWKWTPKKTEVLSVGMWEGLKHGACCYSATKRRLSLSSIFHYLTHLFNIN